MSESPSPSRPTNALLALGAALTVFLVLVAIERSARSCGDGLCGSISGAMAILGLMGASLLFTLRGLKRGEAPRWLFVIPWIVWALALWILLF
ncbi:MAG TPA: hypothetical protein PK812_09075 [Beijerinckiaceae bacterium]|nr:hypothetical protein [Beijerinckiaceae bacterium]